MPGMKTFDITYEKGGFALTVFSDLKSGKNPDNGKCMSSYIMKMSNDPGSFNADLQGIAAQSTMGAELVAVPLAMK